MSWNLVSLLASAVAVGLTVATFVRLRRVERTLEHLRAEGVTMNEAIRQLAADLDAETNAVAAQLDAINAKLTAALAANQTPDPADIAKLQAVSARLKTLGADPANPIPVAPTPAA